MASDVHSRDDRLLDLARRLLDGEKVDWEREGSIEPEVLEGMKRLDRMFRSRDGATETGDATPPVPPAPPPPSPPPRPREDRFIGDFRLVRKLGEGGMGVVYEAEQQHPRRPVALKVIRGGALVSHDTLKLFQRESSTLARLRHPGIAALYETGATEDGLHYFAMELVRGVTLGEWLKKRSTAPTGPSELGVRLRVFKKICDAVAYAHQKGVIHRDLKPGNVLIRATAVSSSLEDAVPDVKVLDFGLARITDSDIQATTYVTELGKIQGTLPYMSPEQVRGNPDEIDLRTDVYSLGVILYEMVTGRLPYDLSIAQLPEAVRIICEASPKSISASFFGARRLDADVVTIAGKCLEKEAWRRYQSAAQLGEDVQRYLSDQPILARPPSATYQLRKLIARHRGAFAFASTVLVLVTALAVTSTVQAVRIARERDRANQEAGTAKRVSEFLEGLFKVSDPSEARGSTITVREILDRGAAGLETELGSDPLVQANLMQTVGRVYIGLGLHEPAGSLLERSLAVRRQVLGEDHPDTLSALNALGMLRSMESNFKDAEPMLHDALEAQRRVLGHDHPETLVTLDNLGLLYQSVGKLQDAERCHRDALERRRRLLGDDDDDTLTSINNLALALQASGKLDEAEPLYREALERRRRTLGSDHPNTITSINNMGYLLLARGKLDETLPYYREALESARRVLGPEHPGTLRSANNMGFLLQALGRPEEAEPFFREALAGYGRKFGDEHPDTLMPMANLGDLYTTLGRHVEAGPLVKAAAERARRILPPTSVQRGFTVRKYGRHLAATGRYPEAESVLREAYDTLVGAVGPDDPQTRKAAQNLVELYSAWGRPDAASLWRQKATGP